MTKPAKCLSILGTGSDVGKSIVVTAICRIFKEMGCKVSPFKAQNMSNNSYVTLDGGEMGRAQVVQAQAAGLEPQVDMNPVLLKPCSNTGSQVVLHGKVIGNKEAGEYFRNTEFLKNKSLESLNRLRSQYELVVMEGAGSCAEVNLRPRDFVNFEMAHAADCPVVLVADIDRGGVFAQIIGSLEVMLPKDRARVKGFIINRFRGHAALFEDGVKYIEEKTGLPVLGVIPYYNHIEIDSEDGLPLDTILDPPNPTDRKKLNIAVIRFPHISNFTDFNALERDSQVQLHYLSKSRDLDNYDAVILPGSKNVRFDLDWLRQNGWEEKIHTGKKNNCKIVGICGGYQMLGNSIDDPEGSEGPTGTTKGLALLDVDTVMSADKKLYRTKAHCPSLNTNCEGYEIHIGITTLSSKAKPFLTLNERDNEWSTGHDGALNSESSVWGSYLHGIFDSCDFRHAWLKSLSANYQPDRSQDKQSFSDQQYTLLAKHFKAHLDMEKLEKIMCNDNQSAKNPK